MVSDETLTKDIDPCFFQFFLYCNMLRFESDPDYSFLKLLFAQAIKNHGFTGDDKYDWNLSSFDKLTV